MKSVLSTKKLSTTNRELLLEKGLNYVEYDAINITNINFEVPKNIENAIFTSQNAVKSFFAQQNEDRKSIPRCFCVGKKTKMLLEKNGQKVYEMSQNASELANFIVKNHKNNTFHFFCGSLKREEIPIALKMAKIELFEVKTYETTLNLMSFDQKWDEILFFSPSGVESFTSENKIKNSISICIGDTTASEAKNHTDNVVVSKEATVEGVINELIKRI